MTPWLDLVELVDLSGGVGFINPVFTLLYIHVFSSSYLLSFAVWESASYSSCKGGPSLGDSPLRAGGANVACGYIP